MQPSTTMTLQGGSCTARMFAPTIDSLGEERKRGGGEEGKRGRGEEGRRGKGEEGRRGRGREEEGKRGRSINHTGWVDSVQKVE